ncbi:MAG: DUF2939 domain-containing protein [Lysobacter sp.]|nr:MAG: DUF2939 domain-containing protein [Lysobacter sp.]
MKKLIALTLLAALVLGAYVAAGPFLTVRAIRDAVERGDTRSLATQVDFELVRASVRAQLEDYLARRMGEGAATDPLRQLASQVTGAMTGGVVEALVTPAGIGALLQGRSVVRRAMGYPPEAGAAPAPGTPPVAFDPLRGATYRYVSASRFDATVQNADGVPIVFVFTRSGLRWRLTDVRLPVDQLIGSLTRR